MQELPLVSIIIPTYNNNPVVCQAIDCSLNQTYENLEIIVVDDGSTDNTEQLLNEKYKGKIVYIRQENKGTGGARNTGIRNASGKYLQFLDADDLLDLDKISIQIKGLLGIPDKALSYCDYVCCDIDDMMVTYKRVSPLLQNEKPLYDIIQKWEIGLSIPVHCFILDIAFFKECGISFDEALLANEDWDCWMNVFALDPKVVFVDKVLAIYRVRRDSRCRNKLNMRKGHLNAINKQIKKNRSNKDIVKKLSIRKEQMKCIYREAGPIMIFMDRCRLLVEKIYRGVVPWRIRRMLD